MVQITSMVAAAVSGAPSAGTPSGTSFKRPTTTGSTVAAISMCTVPTRVGVTSRRNTESRAEIRSGNSDETMTRQASSAGPPSTSAVTEMPMTAAPGPAQRTYPAPSRPILTACNAVQAPLIATVQNTVQDRYVSLPPAARITIVGIRTSPVIPTTTSCAPQPNVSGPGGFSSGS